MRPLRYLWRVPLLLLHIVLGILLCSLVLTWRRNVVMQNGREPFAHRTIRWWSTALLRIFGLRSVRVGKPLADPVLFVANHTSWLDIVLLHSQRAVCFVAKAEIARWPLVGWMAASGGTIFHRRGSNHSLAAVMQLMVERLRGDRSVAVFPEGGTGHNGVLRVFHARIFQAALDAEVAVQPVALRFARDGRRGTANRRHSCGCDRRRSRLHGESRNAGRRKERYRCKDRRQSCFDRSEDRARQRAEGRRACCAP